MSRLSRGFNYLLSEERNDIFFKSLKAAYPVQLRGGRSVPVVAEITVEKRRLKYKEALVFVEWMKRSPYLMAPTIKQLRAIRDVYIAYVDGELAGMLAFPCLGLGWYEYGPLIVLGHQRKKGVAIELTEASLPFIRGGRIFITSHNEVVVKAIRGPLFAIGFREVSPLSLPLPVILAKIGYTLRFFTWRQIVSRKLGLQKLDKPETKLVDPVYAVKVTGVVPADAK